VRINMNYCTSNAQDVFVVRFYNPSNIFARARLVETRHVTEYSPAATGEYPRIFPNFRNCACCKKYLKDNKHNSPYLTLKMCSDIRPWTLSEQIMSAGKYPSIFSSQMEATVYLYHDIEQTANQNTGKPL